MLRNVRDQGLELTSRFKGEVTTGMITPRRLRIIIGKDGLGDMTNNGERLTNICEENDLVIGGTVFAHNDIYKLTWTSPD